MPLPHAIARFNRRVSNRLLEPLARRSSGFAVVNHRGRRSGRRYTTPVNLFIVDDPPTVDGARSYAALTYGPDTDWVNNVLNGPATITTQRITVTIVAATIVGRDTAWPHIPAPVRLALRLLTVRDFLELTTTPQG